MLSQSTLVSKNMVHEVLGLWGVKLLLKKIYMHLQFFYIDKIDFVRDIVAYMCAVALVIGVAYDGEVSCVCVCVCVCFSS